jgi:hypothetical protein
MMHQARKESEEFVDLGETEVKYPETPSGWVLVPQSNSIIYPKEKGYLQTIADRFKVRVTNIYYKFQEASKHFSDVKVTPGNCFLLGKSITTTEELKNHYRRLIFFSYREFDKPIFLKEQTFFNDTCRF